eukprot:CAMPEP_0171792970 /NCGR_PEP_ID=MMETSP0991-20121206/67279_1 /TAXON_ID=483369 /ORGANISM="non described non described, Strain CCMP2098" /LENGTH=37 /DNA_ID= /DNA_START= /DNA_END= /DNA_ORIENTATION=
MGIINMVPNTTKGTGLIVRNLGCVKYLEEHNATSPAT